MKVRRSDGQIAARMREACAALSVHEVARRTGTNAETTRRYLRGISPPSAAFLAALCRSLDIPGTWLLTGQGDRVPPTAIQAALEGATASQLLHALADRLGAAIQGAAPAGQRGPAALGVEGGALDAVVQVRAPVRRDVPGPGSRTTLNP